ncbi:MAG: glycosyltransferase [Deltaproteobacteria bacterium]|nr:glycosyltransferase [Deltaproteobacteria bacterium]
MNVVTALCGLAALSWALLLLSTVLDRLHLGRELLRQPAPEGEVPDVVAVVPARDEAHQIVACVKSLLAQRWPKLRVIVVDDRSTDGTDELVQAIGDPRLQVLHGTELPQGWLGKNHANHQAVQAAAVHGAQWYLFTDADTVHDPDALPTAMAAARTHDAALVTYFTGLTLSTPIEKALMPHIILAIAGLFPARWVNDRDNKTAISNGQFILVRKDAYDDAGGHAAIKDRVCDDLELAKAVKAKGHGLRAEWGMHLVAVRMYTSLAEIWWGFVKNAAHGAGGPLLASLGALAVVLAAVPFFALPVAIALGDQRLMCVSGLAVALAFGQRVFAVSWLFPRISAAWGLTIPFGQLMLAGIVFHSSLRAVTGKGPRWKGREYPDAR